MCRSRSCCHRYGDPLNAWADIEGMEALLTHVKPGALLFLSVPIGYDAVRFNAHRIYGYGVRHTVVRGCVYLAV